MEFSLPNSTSRFVIPDEWWIEADMTEFTPLSSSYAPMQPPYPPAAELPPVPPFLVLIRDVKPLSRDLKRIPGVPLFRSKESLMRILCAIKTNERLPPIVVTTGAPDAYTYDLYDGLHRFYASAAARFTHIPVILRQPGDGIL